MDSKQKEPKWPLLVGSVIPAILAAYGGYLWLHTFNGSDSNEFGLGCMILTTLVSFATYSMLSFVSALPVVAIMSGRSFARSLAITYSFVSWKLSARLFAFFASVFVFPELACQCGQWGFVSSIIVSLLFGIAVIELPHNVKMSKVRFIILALVEALAIATFMNLPSNRPASYFRLDASSQGFYDPSVCPSGSVIEKTEPTSAAP